HLGIIARQEARYAEAVDHFGIAYKVRPDREDYRLALIDALVLAGEDGTALNELRSWVTQEPNRAELWARAALIFARVGLVTEARRAIANAISIAPSNEDYQKIVRALATRDSLNTSGRP
ncbi:MAG TPA: hypothetical protein VFQ05_16400, partial [Candidatus Eisenbacteria bacterium]|nr:hypothetical protein [Candidatus Eisenbacteria bacterium]